ncbi:MAG: ACP S-malonyltransferase [Deltaproteobacteria bacterium]|nr:ACP S-malonyltransferase [Deltaproteobacteria bacterium]
MPPSRPALLFPGQGAQFVGMGRDFEESSPAARRVLDEAHRASGFDLRGLCFDGPEDRLALTEFQQPCVLAVSAAIHAAFAERVSSRPVCAIGHSLGEYSAHVAAGSLDVGDAVILVGTRGQAMQRAVAAGVGAMAALLGTDEQTAQAACDDAGGDVWVANLNGGGQVVISGVASAVERAVASAKQRGVRRAVMLPVSAPFHCPLMEPAARAMDEVLRAAAFAPPAFPIIANVDARPCDDPSRFAALLITQITHRVRFEDCVRTAINMGVDAFIELGPGGKLTGMVSRIAPDIRAVSISSVRELDEAVAALQS